MSRPSKRQKTGPSVQLGAPTAEDTSLAQSPANNVNSSGASVRVMPTLSVPSLGSLCIRVFASNYINWRKNDDLWQQVSSGLKTLPNSMLTRIFITLKNTCAGYLPHETIVTVHKVDFSCKTVLITDSVLSAWTSGVTLK